MKSVQSFKVATGLAVFIAVVGAPMFINSPRVLAQSDNEAARIRRGLEIAPVPLNMVGKDPALVGLGSYWVNAVSDCNSCHTSGQPPNFDFADGGNPYALIPGTSSPQPKVVNPATYLGGGQDFSTADGGPATADDPEIISRNLTPDKTGLAAGGMSLSQFTQVLRTGVDLDQVHPNLPSGLDGKLLQIMPWPTFQNMTDHEIQAIYEYLSSIPCLEGGPGEPPNRCQPGAKTMASAQPKNAQAATRQFQLDGTKSTSADGGPLTYQWTIPQGALQAAIIQGNTPTPTVQFGVGRGTYMFQLTVTDSAGRTSIDVATVTFTGN